MADDRTPFHEGLQNERTALAWTRTGLALAAAVVVSLRLVLDRLGGWSLVLAGVAVPLAVWVLVASQGRYRAAHRALHGRAALPDARLPAAVTLLLVVLGVGELAYLAAG